MDLPVAVIKIRDYILIFGPAYILAVLVGAAIEVAINSRSSPAVRAEAGADGDNAFLQPKRYNVAGSLMQVLGYDPRDRVVPLAVYLWVQSVSASFSWLVLLLTAALSWPLALLRLGFVLVAGALLAVVVPLLANVRHVEWDRVRDGGPEGGEGKKGKGKGNGSESNGSAPAPLHVLLWRAVNARISDSSNGALLGAALGALLISLSPALLANRAVVSGPAAYLWGALLATLSTLTPGVDAPLLSALNTRGLSDAFFMLLLAVGVANFGLLKRLWRTAGSRVTLVYTVAALLLAGAGAWLLGASTTVNALIP